MLKENKKIHAASVALLSRPHRLGGRVKVRVRFRARVRVKPPNGF